MFGLQPSTTHMSPQFHLTFDDYFQTETSFKNNLPPDKRGVFAIDHCNDDESFRSTLEAKVNNKKLKAKARLNENISNDVLHDNPYLSTDDN